MYGGVHSKHSAYVLERYEKAKLSPLADLEALGKLEVKAKQFPTASLGDRCVTQNAHKASQQKLAEWLDPNT